LVFPNCWCPQRTPQPGQLLKHSILNYVSIRNFSPHSVFNPLLSTSFRLMLPFCLTFSMSWEKQLPKLNEGIMTNFQNHVHRLQVLLTTTFSRPLKRWGLHQKRSWKATTVRRSKAHPNLFQASEAALRKIWWRSRDHLREVVDFCYIGNGPFYEGQVDWKVESNTCFTWGIEIPQTWI
jgi:hypothetical protein